MGSNPANHPSYGDVTQPTKPLSKASREYGLACSPTLQLKDKTNNVSHLAPTEFILIHLRLTLSVALRKRALKPYLGIIST